MNTKPAKIDFSHRHTAHCETGVTANLIAHHGGSISEPMIFGIGSGIFFAYLPMFKVGSLPLTSYRMPPGYIFNQACRFLGITICQQRFRSESKAQEALNTLLDSGIPAGCQTGVYWLPYFPDSMRFHFNAHNIVVYGRTPDAYLISDPVIDNPVTCTPDELLSARFAKGPLAPKGRLYYIKDLPDTLDLKHAALKGIKRTCLIMRPPLGPIGARGPLYLAWAMKRWVSRHGALTATRLLGNVVRMQEEIGTGGGGFRYIYAAFLQECASLFDNSKLSTLSDEMTGIGDLWREFAAKAARQCKGRGKDADAKAFTDLAELMRECSAREQEFFKKLSHLSKQL